MTWVIGAPNLSIAAMISDTRISTRVGEKWVPISEFRIRKIHPVGPFTVAGFAGEVVSGFRSIRLLSALHEQHDWRAIDRLNFPVTVDAFVDAANAMQGTKHELTGVQVMILSLCESWDQYQSGDTLTEEWGPSRGCCAVVTINEQGQAGRRFNFSPWQLASIGSGDEVHAATLATLNGNPNSLVGARAFNLSMSGGAAWEMVEQITGAVRAMSQSGEATDLAKTVNDRLHFAVITDEGVAWNANAWLADHRDVEVATTLEEYERLRIKAGNAASAYRA